MGDISIQDIKKAYFTKSSSVTEVLCFSGEKVSVKPIKIKDKKNFLKLLEQENNVEVDKFIDDLIERYVSNENGDPIKANSLMDDERYQLLICIRRASTSADTILITHKCSECEHVNTDISYKFSDIVVKNYEKNTSTDDTITNKNESVKFTIGHLNRGELLVADKYISDKKIDTKIEKQFVYYAAAIKDITLIIDDISNKFIPKMDEKVEFLENLSFDDFNKIKRFFTSSPSYGLTLPLNFTCSNCKSTLDKEAKIVNFFTD
jgi:hypothetical protein